MEQQKSLLPSGLTRKQFEELNRCAATADARAVADLLGEAEAHLRAVEHAHASNWMVNVRLAAAMVDVFRRLAEQWDSVPPMAQPWLAGSVHYFVSRTDTEPDFQSPIGFEDDVEVLNACLRLAGRSDLCLNPEEYDDV